MTTTLLQPTDERAAFEAWLCPSDDYAMNRLTLEKRADGNYAQALPRLQWKVWQARAVLAAQPAPVPVPPGWKLVPVKPTPEMRQAALEMSRGWHPTGCEPMPHAYEIWASDLVYRAMIAASPEKP
jgi:hypothetical protein